MSIRIYQHADCLDHDPGAYHPESAGRLQTILTTLHASIHAGQFDFEEAPLGTQAQVLQAHTAAHWQLVQSRSPVTGSYSLDPDTVLSPGSLNAALRGVGAACAGVDDLMADKSKHVFCMTRPPGHHATTNHAMGFCIFNQVAIAALHAMQQHGLQRVAVVDFDVHHGNGTQEILQGKSGMHYISTHQEYHYPGTGSTAENIPGNISNFPLPAGISAARYQALFTREILPLLEQHRPQLLLVSAGFDAHAQDPLGGMLLDEATYFWLGQQLKAVAAAHCEGRMLSVLEGGYNLAVLGSSVEAWLAGSL